MSAITEGAARLVASRQEQGLSPRCTDAGALSRIAALMTVDGQPMARKRARKTIARASTSLATISSVKEVKPGVTPPKPEHSSAQL